MADTDVLGNDGREVAGRSPAGRELDVVDLLLVQHARVEELFLLVIGSSGPAKREAFHALVQLLAVHETAEEMVVHPLARQSMDDAGDAIVDDRLAEERAAKEMLSTLVDSDVEDEGFDSTLLLLRDAVLTHARYEERYEFPQLRKNVPAERLRKAATAVRAAEAVAPTRPHPGAETAKANMAMGAPLAIVDRVRDAVRKVTEDRPGG